MKQLFFLLAAFITIQSYGQAGQPKSPHDTLTYANGIVTYGRPYKKGRDVFGGLEKFGTVWRLGANEATTISFNSETDFGGVKVPKGTYTMFALINENEWTIILNSVLGQWGAFKYEENKDKDVARVTVPVNKLETVTEQLTIYFGEYNTMYIQWDHTQVGVQLRF